MKYVDVAVPLGVRKTFAYSVPAQLRDQAVRGVRVLVPFGRKIITGFVVGVSPDPPDGNFKVRSIRAVLDPAPMIPAVLVETALWAAERYFTSPGEILKAALPAGSQIAGSQEIRLTPRAERLLAGGLRPTGLSSQANSILNTLSHEGALTLPELSRRGGVPDASRWLGSLAQEGWITIEEKLQRPRVSAKERLGIRALEPAGQNLESLTPLQRALYSFLEPGGKPVPLKEMLRATRASASVAQALARKGLAEIAPLKLLRIPVDIAEAPAPATHHLTAAQEQIFHELRAALSRGVATRYLIHGVTGSGKTEIYLKLIAEVLRQGQASILMVPEIGLTPLLARIATSHFPDQVALMHSAMSPGERFDQWHRIRSGEARVVVGTRSAVFAPLQDLRLVIVDEEQDASYKQDETPVYHAREVAWHRIQQSSGVLLMGSATPSIETFHGARTTKEIRYLALPQRFQARPLPRVTLVDMALEFQRHGKNSVVSGTLQQELKERLRLGEQSIIMLNRRGYATMLLCRSCGHTTSCPDCSIALTYHQEQRRLICHYCGIEQQPPSACTSCGGEYIYYVGVGSEQLEEMLRSMFPAARIARFDRDSTRRRGALRRILLAFAERNLDILVGTQMLAKGHDFPNVTLVGVIGSDAGLSFPDFRSAERTFQLLTQVAGRAGRGETPGQVVIQSFYPNHYVLRFARNQDYTGFFEREIEYRKLLGYPPFVRMVQILVSNASQVEASKVGRKIAVAIKSQSQRHELASQLRILGPAVAPLEKLRGKYRYQVLLKSPPGADLTPLLRDAFAELGTHRVPLKNVQVDIDPLSLL
jgi:primosomal protein N' (replication factor Y)